MQRNRGDADHSATIQRVRDIALALPEASERESHGEPAFFVKKKLFATIDDHHHGANHIAVWCSSPPGVQESLVAAEPQHFFRPPYVGHKGWLGIRLDAGLNWSVVAQLLRDAHANSAAGKKKALL
jgi:hypothetical protein